MALSLRQGKLYLPAPSCIGRQFPVCVLPPRPCLSWQILSAFFPYFLPSFILLPDVFSIGSGARSTLLSSGLLYFFLPCPSDIISSAYFLPTVIFPPFSFPFSYFYFLVSDNSIFSFLPTLNPSPHFFNCALPLLLPKSVDHNLPLFISFPR